MSNRRKPRNHRRPSARPGRPGLDELQGHLAVMFAADDAEARGDARAALDLMASAAVGPDGKAYWRPWRERRLLQLIQLGDVLPRWAISRWILSQALQSLDESSRNRSPRALRTAIDLRGGPSSIEGVNDVDAKCKVIDHDWAYRQLFLYDLGGLRHFLGRSASADLVAGADQIHAWARARMGGYRLHSVAPTMITWEDLASRERVEVVNLGAAVLLEPDETVIGRIVPIEDRAMFESAPLPVPEPVARDVAGNPDAWVEALRRGGDKVRLMLGRVLPEHDLLTDVRERTWRGFLEDLGFGSGDPVDEPCEVIPDAFLLVRVALAAKVEPPAWLLPCVAAALVVPCVPLSLLEYVDAHELAALDELATRLPEPAAAICRGMTAAGRQAS